MKAIHNKQIVFVGDSIAVFNTSKIQNESNSQPTGGIAYYNNSCVQYVKDTK